MTSEEAKKFQEIGELDISKKEAELEKLKTEIQVMKRSPFSKPSNWIPIFVAAGGIITAIAQWQISDVQREKATLEAEKKLFAIERTLEEKQTKIDEAEKKLAASQYRQKETQLAYETLQTQTIQQQASLEDIERTIETKQQLLAQLEDTLTSHADNQATQKFIQESKVIDQKIADTVSELKTQLSTSGSLTEQELRNLVQQINSSEKPERLSAVKLLTDEYIDNAVMIGLILDLFAEPQIEELSVNGRINALFILNATAQEVWTTALRQNAESAIALMEERHSQGTAAIGPQTHAKVEKLKKHLQQITDDTEN